MSDVSNINSIYAMPSFVPDTTRHSLRAPHTAFLIADTVDISPRANVLARASENSSLQIARTRAIRTEISNGTFETRERIEGTVAQLLDVIA